MRGNAEVDRHKTPGEYALCCAMRRGYLKLRTGGREVEEMRTNDSVTIALTSWPYYIWIETRGDDAMVNEDPHLLHQNFSILIKTVNDHGNMALENIPFTGCPNCNKRYAGRLCIFHAIPPWEFVRCFCLAHPDLRDRFCSNHHEPGISECPVSCPYWELIKGEIMMASPTRGHFLTMEKCVLKAPGDMSAYSCTAEMMFHRLGHS